LKVHLIGIGGTGMGAFAGLLQEAGHDVRGSDSQLFPPMSTQLAAAKIPVFEGFRAENLDWDPDFVVVGNVCSREHVEVVAAQARGLALESFPSLLEKVMLPERRPLVVAGTHGKTTTSSLLTWMLQVSGQQPSALVGGVPINLGRGYLFGRGPAIVLEGDEYDTAFFDKGSKFFHYRPFRAIVTSVEFDHADIFADLEAVKAAFVRFVELIPPEGDLVVCADDAGAMEVARAARCKVTTYRVLDAASAGGEDPRSADYTCRVEARRGRGLMVFEVFERGVSLGEFQTTLVGTYNLGNILAALAVARQEGCSVEQLRDAVRRFLGVKRRQELLGIASGIRVVTDFAHHPTAVRLTTTAIRRRFPNGRLYVCFEPRSASSRRAVFTEGYAESFAAASRVHVGPLFRPEKIPPEQRLDPQQLARAIAANGVEATAHADVDELAQAVLAEASPGDTILLLTSGSFGGLGDKILKALGDAVMFATPEDLPAIHALCASYGLKPTIPGDTTETLIIREPEGAVVGCVSLRMVGAQALLFNLAIARERRGEGLGWMLADGILRRARMLGVQQVYLVTTDATDFFAGKLGATPASVEEIDPQIRSDPNFVLGERAVCMKIDPSYKRG
jgi:UDP-N-acetylmuramate: L-alanyl-gamma-D-glutamyl-meso-diaminopimelate ligase